VPTGGTSTEEESVTTDSVAAHLREGMAVRDCHGALVGHIGDVWCDVGVSESWGATGSFPMEGAEAADPTQFAFSEAMPGEGDSYLRIEQAGSGSLYVAFTYVTSVEDGTAVLSVACEDIPAFQWDVRPDFLNNHAVPDGQAPSDRA
jgi:hypothetical protein